MRTGTGDTLYSVYESPVGEIVVSGTDESLSGIAITRKGRVRELDASAGHTGQIDLCLRFLEGYFSKKDGAGSFDGLRLKALTGEGSAILHDSKIGAALVLDMNKYTTVEIEIYRALLSIPFGSRISYGELARLGGVPDGARFAGNTMAKNSFPILVPCHRVVKADCSIGNYTGGPDIKEYLLDHEWDCLNNP